MFLHLPNLLKPEEIETVVSFLTNNEFVDGKLTAGYSAKYAKNNLQLNSEAENKREIDLLVVEALKRNEAFQNAVFPTKFASPLFNKYELGMHYGNHVDNPFIGKEQKLRSDVSISLFLSDPDTYDGGELTVDMQAGTLKFKYPCGDAIAYPTSAIHRVEPVTRGARLAMVTWVQSAVPNPLQREMLYDLYLVCKSLLPKEPNSKESLLLTKTYSNLVRMWTEL